MLNKRNIGGKRCRTGPLMRGTTPTQKGCQSSLIRAMKIGSSPLRGNFREVGNYRFGDVEPVIRSTLMASTYSFAL